jgi:hypothetical protein
MFLTERRRIAMPPGRLANHPIQYAADCHRSSTGGMLFQVRDATRQRLQSQLEQVEFRFNPFVRGRISRSPTNRDLIDLICRMWQANPT